MSKTQKKNKPRTKFSTANFIWFGFNHVVGTGFILAISSNFLQLGVFLPVALSVVAGIAFLSGFAYSRLGQSYSGYYGGTYIYVKAALGNKWGGRLGSFFSGWLIYIQNPLFAAIGVITILFALEGIVPANAQIYLYIASAILYLAIVFIITVGYRLSNILFQALASMKWFVIIGSFIVAIVAIGIGQSAGGFVFETVAQRRIGGNASEAFLSSNMGFNQFASVILVSFSLYFAVGGFNGITTITPDSDAKNRKNLLFKSLFVIFAIALLFYLLWLFAFQGALGDSFRNQGNAATNESGANIISFLLFDAGVFSNAGTIVAVVFAVNLLIAIAFIANKSLSTSQNVWLASRQLFPLARDLPELKFMEKTNKQGQFWIAILIDTALSFIFLGIFIAVAAIFNQLQNLTNYLDTLLGLFGFLLIISDLITLLAVMILRVKKKIKYSKWEFLMYSFVATILSLFLLSYLVIKGFDFTRGIETGGQYSDVVIQIAFFVFFLGLGIVIFFAFSVAEWTGRRNKWLYEDIEIGGTDKLATS